MVGDRVAEQENHKRQDVVSRRQVLRMGGAALAVGPAAALAACASGNQGAAPTQSQQPVTLRFIPAGFHADLDQLVVDQFHVENPRITVSFEPQTGNYVDKVTALQAGNDLPDVIYVADAHVKPFAANKIAADMEK